MQFNISGHHIDVTDALRDYVSKRLGKLATHCDSINSMQVTLSVEKQRQTAEANFHVRNADFVASAEDEDMYAAIDLLAQKLDRQILKYKEKNIERSQGSR